MFSLHEAQEDENGRKAHFTAGRAGTNLVGNVFHVNETGSHGRNGVDERYIFGEQLDV